MWQHNISITWYRVTYLLLSFPYICRPSSFKSKLLENFVENSFSYQIFKCNNFFYFHSVIIFFVAFTKEKKKFMKNGKYLWERDKNTFTNTHSEWVRELGEWKIAANNFLSVPMKIWFSEFMGGNFQSHVVWRRKILLKNLTLTSHRI